jgi:hypothetical protein
MGVTLSAAKHLAFSVTHEDEILRLSPQDDIATQSLEGESTDRLPAERVDLKITTNIFP